MLCHPHHLAKPLAPGGLAWADTETIIAEPLVKRHELLVGICLRTVLRTPLCPACPARLNCIIISRGNRVPSFCALHTDYNLLHKLPDAADHPAIHLFSHPAQEFHHGSSEWNVLGLVGDRAFRWASRMSVSWTGLISRGDIHTHRGSGEGSCWLFELCKERACNELWGPAQQES